jgi:hypothetical protein
MCVSSTVVQPIEQSLNLVMLVSAMPACKSQVAEEEPKPKKRKLSKGHAGGVPVNKAGRAVKTAKLGRQSLQDEEEEVPAATKCVVFGSWQHPLWASMLGALGCERPKVEFLLKSQSSRRPSSAGSTQAAL